MSTSSLILRRNAVLTHLSDMDKGKKHDPGTAKVVAELIASTGMSENAVSKALPRYGGKASPQAVGKWKRTGIISRVNMDALRKLAGTNVTATPELNVSGQISRIHLALRSLATMLTANTPNEARAWKALIEERARIAGVTLEHDLLSEIVDTVASGQPSAEEAIRAAQHGASAVPSKPRKKDRG